MKLFYSIILLMLVTMQMSLHAQDETVTVPDVTGMNVPQAVASLNQIGLNLGEQLLAENAGDTPPNTVVSQSLEAGTSVDYGTAIDLTVVFPSNARFIYDDNDITLINLADGFMNTSNVVFRAIDGNQASFNIAQLGGGLESGDCFQIWSINRSNAKDVAGCDSTNWRTTTNTGAHFWTHTSGATQFNVIENGIERVICPTAGAGTQDAPLTCEFYMAGGGIGNDSTEFIYLTYTEHALAFVNVSEDKWMPTNRTQLYNYNPALAVQGVGGILGDPEVLREEHRKGLGDVTRLAPGQCIVYTIKESGVKDSPVECDVVARRSLARDVVVWVADFEVESRDGRIQKCPAATENKLTRCIVGR